MQKPSKLQQKQEEIEEITDLLWYVSDQVRRIVLLTLRMGADKSKPGRNANSNVIQIKDYTL